MVHRLHWLSGQNLNCQSLTLHGLQSFKFQAFQSFCESSCSWYPLAQAWRLFSSFHILWLILYQAWMCSRNQSAYPQWKSNFSDRWNFELLSYFPAKTKFQCDLHRLAFLCGKFHQKLLFKASSFLILICRFCTECISIELRTRLLVFAVRDNKEWRNFQCRIGDMIFLKYWNCQQHLQFH